MSYKEKIFYTENTNCGSFLVPKSICDYLKERAKFYGVDLCDLVEVVLCLRPTELELSILNFLKSLKEGGINVK